MVPGRGARGRGACGPWSVVPAVPGHKTRSQEITRVKRIEYVRKKKGKQMEIISK
jgi:hypothetical protein